MKAVIGAIILVWHMSSLAADETATALTNFFTAGCSLDGEWTQSALSDINGLIATIESVKNNPNCSGISASLNQLNFLKTYVGTLDVSENEKMILSLRRQQTENLLMLSEATDPIELETLKLSLQGIRSNLAYYEGQVQGDGINSRRDKRERGIQNSVIAVSSVLKQMNLNNECWQENKSILPGVGSLVASIMVGFASPALAVPLQGGVQLLGSLLEFFENSKTSESIGDLNSMVGGTGLFCAMENLSKRYCDERDALKLIHFVAEVMVPSRPQIGAGKNSVSRPSMAASVSLEPKFWEAVHFLQFELPIIDTWLREVRAGTNAFDIQTGQAKKDFISKEGFVKGFKQLASGIIESQRRIFEKQTETANRNSTLKATVNKIFGQSFGVQGSGTILHEVVGQTLARFFLLGLDSIPLRGTTVISFDQFDILKDWPTGLPRPDMNTIADRLGLWTDKADSLLAIDRLDIIQEDPLAVLVKGVNRKRNPRGISPLISIGRLVAFLNERLKDGGLEVLTKFMYEDTSRRLAMIKSKLEVGTTAVSNLKPEDILQEISTDDVANLRKGSQFLMTRLEDTVREYLTEQLLVSSPSTVIKAKLLAATDIYNELSRFTSQSNMTELRNQVSHAHSLTRKTISTLFSMFGGVYENELSNAAELTAIDHTSVISGVSLNLNNVCGIMLAAPLWTAKMQEICAGTILTSPFPNFNVAAPRSDVIAGTSGGDARKILGFSQEGLDFTLSKREFEDRVCVYRDFLRKSRVFQKYQERRTFGTF